MPRIFPPPVQYELPLKWPKVRVKIKVVEKIVEKQVIKNIYIYKPDEDFFKWLESEYKRVNIWNKDQELECNRDRCMGIMIGLNKVKNYFKEEK